ncbi:major histocompatibility complex class I-related gene protein-like [Sardina pilchardus]|uniref:major histocompatibility complex class I-related gene protein-like n=1 Tax=Sardina pilchardus TaxID=27697 RepID=UPI002E148F89
MDALLTLLGFLTFAVKTSTGSHSLVVFATFIIGHTPFPEFSAVVMLDDVQLGYYDSDVRKFILRGLTSEPEDVVLQEDASVVFGHVNRGMKYRASHLRQRSNLTGAGIYVQQRITGCELLDDDQPGPMAVKDAFNGQTGDHLSFTNDQHSFWNQWQWPAMWDKLQFSQVKWLYENIYQPICLRTLRTYLRKQRNRVMRKVKPRVRLLQKTLPDSRGAKVTCLATGFYPRHINLTLLRDGQSVSDHQITGGELLPNGDETYQMRKSLEVSPEELQHHHYTCTAEHLSLDNKLDIALGSEWGSATTTIASTALVAVCVCLIGAATGVFLLCKKNTTKDKGSQISLQSNYTATPGEDPSEASSDTHS